MYICDLNFQMKNMKLNRSELPKFSASVNCDVRIHCGDKSFFTHRSSFHLFYIRVRDYVQTNLFFIQNKKMEVFSSTLADSFMSDKILSSFYPNEVIEKINYLYLYLAALGLKGSVNDNFLSMK